MNKTITVLKDKTKSGKINLLFIKCEKFILIILEYKHVI